MSKETEQLRKELAKLGEIIDQLEKKETRIPLPENIKFEYSNGYYRLISPDGKQCMFGNYTHGGIISVVNAGNLTDPNAYLYTGKAYLVPCEEGDWKAGDFVFMTEIHNPDFTIISKYKAVINETEYHYWDGKNPWFGCQKYTYYYKVIFE